MTKKITPARQRSLDNLEKHKWKKGQSGNAKGRPTGSRHVKTILRELAETEVDFKNLSNKKMIMPAGEAVITALFARAMYKGDTKAMEMILDRLMGKVTQGIDLVGEVDHTVATDLDRNILKHYYEQEYGTKGSTDGESSSVD